MSEGPTANTFSASNANKRVGWGPLEAILIGVAAFFAPQFILGLAIVLTSVVTGQDPKLYLDSLTNLENLLITMVVSLASVWIVMRYVRRRGGLKALGFSGFKPNYLVLALLGYGVYFVAFLAALYVLAVFVPSIDLEQAQQTSFDAVDGLYNYTLAFMSLVILPPLYEEILFRGFAFQGIARSVGFWPAALAVNGLFGLAHGQINVAVDTFLLGMVAAWLVWKTKSLWPAIGLHALKNLVAFLFKFIIGI